jgi:predicted nucleotidyltransferase
MVALPRSISPACPPGVVERIVELTHPDAIWLFGSRARGTANADSDWDLLIVLPDAVKDLPDDDSLWFALRDVRRSRVDLSFIRRRDFEIEQNELGTLSQIAVADGYIVYAP